jgi:protein-arginine kinase activator protein McsA
VHGDARADAMSLPQRRAELNRALKDHDRDRAATLRAQIQFMEANGLLWLDD